MVLRTTPSALAAPAGDAAHRPPKGGILTAAERLMKSREDASLRDAFLSPPEADSSFHGKELGGL